MSNIRKINSNSDFKMLFTLSGSCIGVPFRWIFYIGRSRFMAERTKDGTFINCSLVDDSHVMVYFNSHNFGVGRLEVEFRFFHEDSSYTDGISNYVSRELLDVELWGGYTDDDDKIIESSVFVNAFRGFSAYELAVQNGYTGTFEEWLELGGYSQEVIETIGKNVRDTIQPTLIAMRDYIRHDIDPKIENIETSIEDEVKPMLLTEQQQAWLISKMQGDIQVEANNAYVVTTSLVGNKTWYLDESKISDIASSAKVSLTFDGKAVKANYIPSGWSEVADGYTYSLNNSVKSVAKTSYTYTAIDGIYRGISVTKQSDAVSITTINPAYYGIVTTDSVADIESIVSQLTRTTSNISSQVSLANSSASDAGYLWVLVKGSATATQLGSSIMSLKTSSATFKSPKNSGITMSGYKLYISDKSVAAGGTLDNVSLTINL